MDKILLVEDTDSLREVLKSVLESEGYTVDSCSNAESAIESIKRGKYSLILSDFKLPQKNGLELLQATREISKQIPFLLMTAYGSIEIAVEAMKEGANDFITKPFKPEKIVYILKRLEPYVKSIEA